uniref:Uridylate-specific endoribonuclease n=1 Tax=Mesocestoides corti TaxID=53468 RepID=A0A5K3FZM3_MESCO
MRQMCNPFLGALTNQDDARDLAPAPLCTIKINKLKSSPVYNSFLDLLDNYEHRVGFAEVETPKKRSEANRFLEAVLSTETMKGFHRYLVQKKLVSPDIAAFKMELHNLWFQPYKRLR